MIIDSSSLIIFAKINKLELLSRLYEKIYITNEIYRETVEQGLAINSSDAKIIKSFIDNKEIGVLKLNHPYENFSINLRSIYSQLGIGESDAIALSLQKENKALIIDESLGRQVAKLYNIKPIGSLRILLEAYKKEFIDEIELKGIIKDMIRNKFRIGAEVIEEFWNYFEKIKSGKS